MVFDYAISMRRLSVLVVLLITLLLGGCGGSGGGDTPPQTTPMSLTINWPNRGRAVTPPSSALSARITIRGASATGTDLVFVANRGGNPDAHSQTYTSSQGGVPGTRTVSTRFYAQADGVGDVVGEATFTAQIGPTGQIGTNVTVDSTIDHVVVAPNQHVWSRKTRTLVATAFDAANNAIVLQPDAFVWAVTAGETHLRFENGLAEGLIMGDATVTASVDQVTSSSEGVEVRPTATIQWPSGSGLDTNFYDISDDGTTVVGTRGYYEGLKEIYRSIRWTAAGGFQWVGPPGDPEEFTAAHSVSADGARFSGYIATSPRKSWVGDVSGFSYIQPTQAGDGVLAYDMTADGLTVVGAEIHSGISRACSITNGQPAVFLGAIPDATESIALTTSRDGTRIAGLARIDEKYRAAVWINGVGQLIPTPPGQESRVRCISGNGDFVFGYYEDASKSAFRWSVANGVEMLPLNGAAVWGTNLTGDIVVEQNHVWTVAHGKETVREYLARTYGLVSGDTGPVNARDVSADGKTLVGLTGWVVIPVATD